MGGASEYTDMVKYDIQNVDGTRRNSITQFTYPVRTNVYRLFKDHVLETQLRSLCKVSWLVPTRPPQSGILSVAYGNGVIVVTNGSLWYSNDKGATWSQADGTLFPGGSCSNVTFGGGKFVAVGNLAIDPSTYRSTTPNNYYSTDGKVWTQGFFNTYSISPRVAYTSGQWIVANYYYGMVNQGGIEGLADVIITNNAGGVVGTYGFHPLMNQVNAIASDGTTTLVVGVQQDIFLPNYDDYGNQDGFTTVPGEKALRITSNATGIPFPQVFFFTAAGFGNGIWVLAGIVSITSIMFYSTDTVTWTQVEVDPFNAGYAYAIRFIDGVFYALGTDATKGCVMKSTDGQQWTPLAGIPTVLHEYTDIIRTPEGNLILVGVDGVWISTVCA